MLAPVYPDIKVMLPIEDGQFVACELMRQQFLAHEMEQAGELGADVVSLLHIAPHHNHDFRWVTSAALNPLGDTAVDVWKALTPSDRFASISTEELFGPMLAPPRPEMRAWQAYIAARYPWALRA
jgi:hypothetical protein